MSNVHEVPLVDLFAGVPVRDYERATAWYERHVGAPPSFLPNDGEAVWEVAEHQFSEIGFGGGPV